MAINRIYKAIPTVAVRGIVILPGVRFHFDIARSKSIAAIEAAMKLEQKVILVTQKDPMTEAPVPDDLYTMGVIANIKQILCTYSHYLLLSIIFLHVTRKFIPLYPICRIPINIL